MTDSTQSKAPDDFSLVLGGPLYQFYLRSRLARPPLGLLAWRILVIAAIVWLPLLVLALVAGQAVGGGLKVPFLQDIEVHVRYLLVLPLLITAELVVHKKIRPVVGQFFERGVIPPEERARFESAVASAMRLRNSVAAEVLLLVFVFTVGHCLWTGQLSASGATWYATVADSRRQFSPAGYWYGFVSIPIFQLLLFRWYFRLFIWARFLWQVSRLDLQLKPAHPDRAGGEFWMGSDEPDCRDARPWHRVFADDFQQQAHASAPPAANGTA